MSESTLRAMPHSLDAEQAIISSMLGYEEAIDLSVSLLGPGDFYSPTLRFLFEVIVEMNGRREPVDLVTISQKLADMGELEKVGGAGGVADLIGIVPSMANVEYYAKILREKSTLRAIITTSYSYAERAYQFSENVPDFLDAWQSEVMAVSAKNSSLDSLRHIREGVETAIDTIEHAYENRGGVAGLDTGFVDLNRMTGGLKGGQLIIIAGRPAMGKSVMGVNLAENIAAIGTPSAVFSLEMSYDELCQRSTCSAARLDLGRIRDGFLSQADFPRLVRAASDLVKLPLYIDDTPALSINEFRSRARRAVQKLGVGFIVIDYVQLMRSTSKRAEMSKVVEMGEISAALKQTAKELNIPIVVLAQLNRNVEERRGNIPQQSDLRDSGNLEQDADIIGLLYREAYYCKKDEQREARAEAMGITLTDFESMSELIIAKQRNGPTGSVKLKFIGEQTRFESMTEKAYSNNPEEHQRR